jgi:hypothetical protein
MTVLALDARHYACNAGAPSLQHVSCVAVSVADTWTGESIAALLQRVIATIGRPVAYLKDGGTDLGKAVRLLQEKGLGGVSIDDLSHVVANLVKHAYRAHPMFDVFLSTCGKVSSMLKQSVLACLAPPKVSTKARFMNLHRLVKWAARVLQQSPRGRAANGSLLQKLRERLDRLPQCRAFINAFLQDVEPILECQALLKTKGLSQDSANECWPMIERIPTPSIRRGLTDWIEKQLAIASLLGLCETGMPISSDTIESLFGVAKTHGTGEIKDANRIAPRIPVLCGPLTRQDAENSLQISVDEQREWSDCSSSLTKQRRHVFGDIADSASNKLVVMPPERTFTATSQGDTQQAVLDILTKSGTTHRTRRNTLVFLVADEAEVSTLKEGIRGLLAAGQPEARPLGR